MKKAPIHIFPHTSINPWYFGSISSEYWAIPMKVTPRASIIASVLSVRPKKKLGIQKLVQVSQTVLITENVYDVNEKLISNIFWILQIVIGN